VNHKARVNVFSHDRPRRVEGGVPAISPNFGMCIEHLDQEPWRWSSADRRVAEEMSSYWVNFAKSGNPNGPGLPAWPAFTDASGKVLYVGDPVSVGPVANINSLTVFDAVYSTVRGKAFAATTAATPEGPRTR
jgi:Carboxylesterase family